MALASQPTGRRERNKQAKLERITAAASELFAKYGVDDVTTQQIADKADIGTGTLFLYCKTKGEVLLLVQNAHYAAALERGRLAASKISSTADSVLSVLEQIVKCNRVQVDNGRTYLREILFGDPSEPHHSEALTIVAQTEEVLAEIIAKEESVSDSDAATLSRVVTSIIFLTMASSLKVNSSVPELVENISQQVRAILPH